MAVILLNNKYLHVNGMLIISLEELLKYQRNIQWYTKVSRNCQFSYVSGYILLVVLLQRNH